MADPIIVTIARKLPAARNRDIARLARCHGNGLSLRWINFLALLRLWAARRRERQALHELDAHLLRDIGVGRVDADREARLPFWRP